jgi:hypothetical protein
MDFYEDTKPTGQYVNNAATNNTYYGSGVDMTGYEGVVFLATAQKGAVSTLVLKAQEDSDSAYGTAADLLGSAVNLVTAVGTDGFCFVDIKNPAKRYVRPALVVPDLGSAPIAVSIIAIRYNVEGGEYAISNSTVGELHVAPAEGTA